MKKEIKARGNRMHTMDCVLQQVQCECGEIFEAWTVKKAEFKFDKHECELEQKPKTNEEHIHTEGN